MAYKSTYVRGGQTTIPKTVLKISFYPNAKGGVPTDKNVSRSYKLDLYAS